MTEMERPVASPENTDLGDLRTIVQKLYASVEEPYPFFTRVHERDGKIISVGTLTLEEAIQICGPLIASVGMDTVLRTIAEMREHAISYMTNDPEFFEMTKEMGQLMLQKYQR